MINHKSIIGKDTNIEYTAIIQENCVIGDKCFVGHYVVMRPNTVIGSRTVVGHLTVFEGDAVVGNDCLIHAQCHITKGATIEDKVFIGPMFCGANDRYMVHQRRHIRPFVIEGYHIKYGARIGIGVMVLPGITIGRNAVVGVGSVVSRDIPDNECWMGVPAKFKKMVPEEERL
jgi:acetyltransferase-like isoleucine patch superfamily enzyme